MRKGRSLGPCR